MFTLLLPCRKYFFQNNNNKNNNNNNLFYKFRYKLLVPQIAIKLVGAKQDEHENIMENKNYNKLQNMLEKRKRNKRKKLNFTYNADLDKAMQQN